MTDSLPSASVIPLTPTHGTEHARAASSEFTLDRIIGRGATGVVYEAIDHRCDRRVAIKVLLPEHGPQARRAFHAEARVTAQCTHPHLIPVLGLTTINELPAYVMPLITGGSLADASDAIGRIDPRRLAGILRQIASALDELHSRGLTHRDVKPDNVLLQPANDSQPHAYLSDIGAGVAMHAHDSNPPTRRPLGTLGFAAPEQLNGEPCDTRSDVYGLGALAFWCLTGEYATPTRSGSAPVTDHRPDLDPSIDLAIGAALASHPVDRPSRATDAADAMADALDRGSRPTLSGPNLRLTTPPAARRRWRRGGSGPRRPGRRFAVMGMLGAIVLAAGIGGATFLTGRPAKAKPSAATGTAPPPALSAEQALLAAVPTPLRASCTPTDSMSQARAGLKCSDATTNTVVLYGIYDDAQTMDAWFDQITRYLPPPTANGSCAAGTPARANWRATNADSEPTGRLRCASNAGRSDIIWTTTDQRVFAAASSPMDLAQLWKWWQTTPGPVHR